MTSPIRLLCQSCGNPLEPGNTGTICWTVCLSPLLKKATGAPAVIPTIQTPQPVTKKGTTMATTTKPVDHGIDDHFYASVELQIEPELGQAATFNGNRLSLKQTKDQDVRIVDGQVKVVEQVVTAVKQSWTESEYLYDYPDLKKDLQKLADVVKASGSTLRGHVIINDGQNSRRWFRLVVENDKVVAQAALLGWTDGTKSPFPKFSD